MISFVYFLKILSWKINFLFKIFWSLNFFFCLCFIEWSLFPRWYFLLVCGSWKREREGEGEREREGERDKHLMHRISSLEGSWHSRCNIALLLPKTETDKIFQNIVFYLIHHNKECDVFSLNCWLNLYNQLYFNLIYCFVFFDVCFC